MNAYLIKNSKDECVATVAADSMEEAVKKIAPDDSAVTLVAKFIFDLDDEKAYDALFSIDCRKGHATVSVKFISKFFS